jgi:hypothetical protein
MTRTAFSNYAIIPKAIPRHGFNYPLVLGQPSVFVLRHVVVAANPHSFLKMIDHPSLLGTFLFLGRFRFLVLEDRVTAWAVSLCIGMALYSKKKSNYRDGSIVRSRVGR